MYRISFVPLPYAIAVYPFHPSHHLYNSPGEDFYFGVVCVVSLLSLLYSDKYLKALIKT